MWSPWNATTTLRVAASSLEPGLVRNTMASSTTMKFTGRTTGSAPTVTATRPTVRVRRRRRHSSRARTSSRRRWARPCRLHAEPRGEGVGVTGTASEGPKSSKWGSKGPGAVERMVRGGTCPRDGHRHNRGQRRGAATSRRGHRSHQVEDSARLEGPRDVAGAARSACEQRHGALLGGGWHRTVSARRSSPGSCRRRPMAYGRPFETKGRPARPAAREQPPEPGHNPGPATGSPALSSRHRRRRRRGARSMEEVINPLRSAPPS